MNIDFENVCLEIYDKLFELSKQINDGIYNQKSLLQDCIDFEKKWLIKIGAENIQFQNEIIKEFEITKSKLLRKTKKCVILGSVSSGKSTLINALLAKEILPTGFGSTSNCFVEIVASSTKEKYLFVNNEKRRIAELKELNNIKSTNHLKNGSLITMYYDKNECEILKNNIAIIDAPGINFTSFHNSSMEEYFKDADVVVLVVSAISGITTLDEQFFKEFRTRYTKLNLIIIFNFWDIVNPNGDNISLQEQCYTNAKNILCNMLQLTDAEAHSSIFFISASERNRVLTKKIKSNSGRNKRNESFNSFLNHLQEKMSESILTKNYNYLIHLKSIVTSSLNQCQNCVSQIKNERSNIAQNIKFELNNIQGFQEKFNKIISEKFEPIFELILSKCFFLLESDIENENIKANLNKLVIEIINLSLETLKKILIDIIKHEDKNISTFRQNIFNEIYFPRYFNLNKELKSFNIQDFEINLIKIKIEMEISGKSFDRIAIGAFGVVGGLVGGLVGSAKGAATGFASGAALATAMVSGNQKNFILKEKWKKNDFLRKLFNSFIQALKNSYSEFIGCMIPNVSRLVSPIENKIFKIQNNLNNIAEKFHNLQGSRSTN